MFEKRNRRTLALPFVLLATTVGVGGTALAQANASSPAQPAAVTSTKADVPTPGDKPDAVDVATPGDKADVQDKAEAGDKADAQDKAEAGDKADAQDKAEAGDKADAQDKAEAGDKADAQDKAEAGDKADTDNVQSGVDVPTPGDRPDSAQK